MVPRCLRDLTLLDDVMREYAMAVDIFTLFDGPRARALVPLLPRMRGALEHPKFRTAVAETIDQYVVYAKEEMANARQA